jgi:archaellum component FlaC
MDRMNELEAFLRRFRRRLRLRSAWELSQRLLWIPILVGLLIQIIGRIFPIPNLWVWTIFPLLLWLPGTWLVAYLRRFSLMHAASLVDQELDLKERLSSALAFQGYEAPRQAVEFYRRQRADAVLHAADIQPSAAFPFQWLRRPMLAAGVLFLLTSASLFLPNRMDLRLQQRQLLKDAAQEQAQSVERLAGQVKANEELSPEAKEELIRQLEELAEALRLNPGDLEQALADLSRFDEQVSAGLDPSLDVQQVYLDLLAKRLSSMVGSEAADEATETSQAALEKLEETIESLTDEELEQLARQLAQMSAQASQAGASEQGQALASLAQALTSGDAQSTGQAIQNLQASLEGLDQQLSDQNAQEAALAQSRAAQAALGRTGQSIARSQGSSGQQGSGSQPGQGANQGQPGGGGGSQANTLPPFTGGNANVPSPHGQAAQTQTGIFDDQVYAPWERSASEGDELFIPGQDTGEGETSTRESEGSQAGLSNPALMPYAQVYPQYLNAANQALDKAAIPLELRDYVRLYFSSLEPR